jgi:hypothetical protein
VGRSSLLLHVSIVLLVVACAPALTPAPVVVAPLPKVYSCAQQRQVAAELRALPADAILRQVVADYGEERDRLRAALKLPPPAACP